MGFKVFALFAGLLFSNVAFANGQLDCREANACVDAGGSNGFAELSVQKVDEKTRIESGYTVRDLTITVAAYFPTLLAGKPIVGQYYDSRGLVLFIMAPLSDLDAPSDVTATFAITSLNPKVLVRYFDGERTVELGEY